jgi:hypothetical protein
LLAKAHRELNEFSEERKTLETLAGISGDAYETFVRLMELGGCLTDFTKVNFGAFLLTLPASPIYFPRSCRSRWVKRNLP